MSYIKNRLCSDLQICLPGYYRAMVCLAGKVIYGVTMLDRSERIPEQLTGTESKKFENCVVAKAETEIM